MPNRAGLRNIPPLHCLLAFEAVGRTLSLAKAAGELSVTASAVGQSIAMLEDRVGLQLVRRLAPQVQLTPVGWSYLATVQAFTHRMRDDLCTHFPVGHAQLRISTPQALGRRWLAPRLGRFMRRVPRLDLVVDTTEHFQPLGDGGVDVALRYGAVEDDRHLTVQMWSDQLVAVAAPALAQRCQGLAPHELMRGVPIIDHPSASWRLWLGGDGSDAGDYHASLRCTDLDLGIQAAALGMGVVLSPARLVASALAAGSLVRVTQHAHQAKAYSFVTSRTAAARAPVREFLAWLQAELDEQ
ncbi:LysR substrate-binding domain-containing protein [Ideonella sp. BN130291]|uniref:LysR substrate-binding domain-containing protein n=1 Tax=Ideonella sp. BN130291 TaxID=3112940 RepID=UPI002E261681|nr:LysR substrate-binding domain-containing protein [Ideonella sp. BN130291]